MSMNPFGDTETGHRERVFRDLADTIDAALASGKTSNACIDALGNVLPQVEHLHSLARTGKPVPALSDEPFVQHLAAQVHAGAVKGIEAIVLWECVCEVHSLLSPWAGGELPKGTSFKEFCRVRLQHGGPWAFETPVN